MAEEKVIAKVWYFVSKSSKKVPKPKYETLLYTDDTTSCGCKGWCMKKAGQERSCRHTRLVDSGQADHMCDDMHDYTKKKKKRISPGVSSGTMGFAAHSACLTL